MIKAVLENGTIQPLESLPAAWTEGSQLLVEEARLTNGTAADRDDPITPTNPDDDQRLQAALAEVRQQAKVLARQEMGLS